MKSERKQRRTQEERRSETRRALIEATMEAVQSVGAIDATTGEIARRAGVTRGALQHHFVSRSALMLAARDEMLSRIGLLDIDPCLKNLPLPIRVSSILNHYLEAFRNPSYSAILAMWLGDLSARDAPDGRNGEISTPVHDLQAALDASWLEIFYDVAIDEIRLLTLRKLATDCMRGRAVIEALGFHSDPKDELRLLSETILQSLLADHPTNHFN